jgi:electron transfer flavoprotein alpha subunit/transcriptional regulator with XRE-family HTH domain
MTTIIAEGVMNKDIWVYGDTRSERLLRQSLKVLAKAREIAGEISGKTAVVLVGEEAEHYLPADLAADQCVLAGADRVYILDGPALSAGRADTASEALKRIIKDRSPMLVLFALTDHGRDLAARTARLLEAGLIADCVDLRVEEDGSRLKPLTQDTDARRVVATCSAWGGEVMAEITFADGQGTGLATVRPHGLKVVEAPGDRGDIERVKMDGIEAPAGLKLISSSFEGEGSHRLEEAEIVVTGGAGLSSAQGFGLARELAAALGGEVGATRPAVLQHWASEQRLIGQTGKTVRPKLHFSIGTSGAVQYTAGIMESGTIVAINRDPDAPIFEVADIGVVADAKTLLPALTERVKRVVMKRLSDMLDDERGAKGDKGFGGRVRELRESHGFSVESLAQATGKSPDFIESVEAGEETPSVAFLLGLAKALSVDPNTFLSEEARGAMRDRRAEAFVTRTENYSYQTLSPGAEYEHLRAFMITIEPRKAHKPVAYKHEGEEFVFVLEGELELTLGSKAHHLKPGESMHFNSEIAHKLKSLSEVETRCLVILYTP